MKVDMEKIDRLQNSLEFYLKNTIPGKNYQKLMSLEKIDRRLYGIYLVETFHYTRQNTKNQALVACREEKLDVNYMKFCLHHAQEEAGHEYMALADLNSMEIKLTEENLPAPLPATQALIGYLNRIALNGNPLARLGYSYWAESVYNFNKSGVHLFKGALSLKDSQMTFFMSHAKIDADHFEEVKNIITRFVKTEQDLLDIEETMIHTLTLTRAILDGVIGEYLKMLEGNPTRYHLLEQLKSSVV